MKKLLLAFLILSQDIYALPIDWNGVLGFDTTSIYNYRRLEKKSDDSNFGNDGSFGTQEVPIGPGGTTTANWQSYIFRLEPSIIINDAATIKSELSTGYGRGGRLGDSGTQSLEQGFGNALYTQNVSDGKDSIIVNKLYVNLYSDTATYVLGRQSSHYGLGALVHSGDNTWDRFSFVRDGITAKIKLSSFKVEPYWARVSSGGSLTRSSRVKEYGVSIIYDSIERDMAFGLLYGKKKSSALENEYNLDLSGTLQDPETATSYSANALGKNNVKIIDVYFEKSFGDFNIGMEVPILSGEIGNVFQENTKYKAKAIILESSYKASNTWTIGFNGGRVSGDDGNSRSYDAMYLNPNYQVANLLFRYNMRAIANQDVSQEELRQSVYDSYINNALYLKAFATYTLEKWTWDFGFIWAKADQTAQTGRTSYNHLTNRTFTAVANQEDDLGFEIDLNFNYKWNNEISVGGAFGYLFTGDYYGYNNSATPNEVTNSYMMQFNTAISF